MEDFQGAEEKSFIVEEVNTLLKESIESTLQNAAYHHNKVPQWTSNIVELVLKRLSSLNKPFKYVVNCVIMQKNGAGLHSASSCYWDAGTDGVATYRYESKTMYCIVNVFGLALTDVVVAMDELEEEDEDVEDILFDRLMTLPPLDCPNKKLEKELIFSGGGGGSAPASCKSGAWSMEGLGSGGVQVRSGGSLFGCLLGGEAVANSEGDEKEGDEDQEEGEGAK
ncbi:Dynein light chain Tctex-type [Chytridiales sp. JEL 0842]|nr:Dynein light chain Tctex-type [Chytridiales sp. JEL 0842]